MAELKSARGSFQQLLLFAFLLITALLVGVALRSVFQYDALMAQSRDAAARALHAFGRGAVARRAQRRAWSARGASRWCSTTRCCAAASTTPRATPARCSTGSRANGLPASGPDQWRAQLGVIEGLMSGPPDTALARESSMAMQFRDLDALNTNIAQQVAVPDRDAEQRARASASRTRAGG